MDVGDIYFQRHVRLYNHGHGNQGWVEYKAKKHGERKYSNSFMFMYLGTLPFDRQLEDGDEEIEMRMNWAGWKKMTQKEYERTAQKWNNKFEKESAVDPDDQGDRA